MDYIRVDELPGFDGPIEGRLCPLTLLTGENGTGKTVFLDTAAAVHAAANHDDVDDRWGRALRKTLRATVRRRLDDATAECRVTIEPRGNGPARTAAVHRLGGIETRRWRNEHTGIDEVVSSNGWEGTLAALLEPADDGAGDARMEAARKVATAFRGPDRSRRTRRFHAPAPRVYDWRPDALQSERTKGFEALAAAAHDGDETWRKIAAALETFGAASGLYETIEVRRHGNWTGDPYTILTTPPGGGAARDVAESTATGRVLPLAFECARADAAALTLIEQPEIGLHPSAEAALASLIAASAGASRRFIVETHGDFFQERVRLDVRDGAHELDVDDVNVLYFEKRAGGAAVHDVFFDAEGNVEGTPHGYRRFMMVESARSLGLDQ